ncbi:hypothetical protein [Pseudarthrobacter enclensis]|uniref:hypothetical protein n=1 Tax=Pseudarthrobacter enclensis TaxID=993070 RepID=UPI003EE0A9F8
METLKKIVRNQYFPAGAVLAGVVLFWLVGVLGGLSLLHNNQPPLTTLTWLLFVYTAAVLTPLAGLLAALDLFRRWRRNRAGVVQAIDEDADEDMRPSAETLVPATAPHEGPYDQAQPPVDGEHHSHPAQDRQPRSATPPRPGTAPGAGQAAAGTAKKNPKQPGGRKAA